MATNRISVLVALDGADEGLKRAITSAEKSLGELSSSAKTAADKASAGMAEVKSGMSAFGEQISRAKTQLLAFVSITWAAGKVQEIVQIADAWSMMGARLKLATAGQREYAAAQAALFDIAQRIGVPIQETATLYGKLQQAVRMLGGEQRDALTITESISQALRISGASATEAQSSLLQFGQALASGVLRGEEFNSVVENSPRLAQALADGLNVPIGRLRKMAEEGRLTADVVVNALMGQKEKLASEYAQLPQTVSQAMQRITNAFGQWVSRLDESTGFTKKLAEALTWLAQNMDTVMQWLTRISEVGLAVLIYRLIPALITAWQTAGAAAVTAASASAAAWTAANLSVSAAVASVGLLKSAFGVLGAFLIGWEIGTWLSEKFEIVRKAGIFMVEILVRAVEQLQYRWEVFAAVFTSDTIEQATKRHEARLAEMNGIFAQMYAQAVKGSQAAQGAMLSAGTASEEIAKRLEAVRQGTQEAVGRGVEAVHQAIGKLTTRLGEVEQSVTRAQQVIGSTTAQMAEAYKGLTATVQEQLLQQVQAVQARYATEKAALDTSSQSQATQIREASRLIAESLTQQSALRQSATVDTLKLIDAETLARKTAAERQGQTEAERSANVTRVENEILATRRQTLATAVSEYRAHIDALNAEAGRHLSEIQRIEEQKRLLSLSTEERIREIRRQGMGEFEATEDRKRQVAELQQKARELLADGEFEQSRQLAQKAMDLAAQVASAQTLEAKRAQDARTQAEQNMTQVVQLEAQAREAYRKQEYATAEQLMKQADALRADIANKTQASDQAAVRSKGDVNQAIGSIRTSEDLLNQSLEAEGRAHQSAAQAALSARDAIKQTLVQTETQIVQITSKLKDGLKVTIDADASRFNQAIVDLDKAMGEKQFLLAIQADLQQAEKKLAEYEQLLKEGKTLPVDADVSQARVALDKLKVYAEQNSQFELKVATEKARSAITNVESQILALSRILTESRHQVSSNADAARAQILSLNGMNTASTHTITVRRVEANASGGLVGSGLGLTAPGFARGGAVGTPPSTRFPRMSEGSVPGSGDQDTVARSLDAGAFVLRKAAVQKYGRGALSRLAGLGQAAAGVAQFAAGGAVNTGGAMNPVGKLAPEALKRNRDAFEAQRLIDLGLKGMREFMHWSSIHYGTGQDVSSRTFEYWDRFALQDRLTLQRLMATKSLSTRQRAQVDAIKVRWRFAMEQPLVYGRDLEGELLAAMAEQEGNFYQGGGLAPPGQSSDTVPAMLTPGEYVVNRQAVSRLGAGFLNAINNMSLPARALALQVQGFASGGLVQSTGSLLARPVLTEGSPARTVRVELAAGDRKVSAAIDQRDESRLLQLLDVARARST